MALSKSVIRSLASALRSLTRHPLLFAVLLLGAYLVGFLFWAAIGPVQSVGEVEAAFHVQRSLRFNGDDSANLSKTLTTPTNSRIYTISTWVKRANFENVQQIFSAQQSNGDLLYLTAGDELEFQMGGGATANFTTLALFRDPSAWTHFVVAVDTTQSTDTHRVRFYINGGEFTASDFSVYAQPSQNASSFFNTSRVHRIGSNPNASSEFFDGYLADFYFIDGQQLTASDFAATDSTTGSWKAKAYTGTYGTNGFHLDFTDSATLGNDVSGNNNDWTANTLDATDQVRDTPANTFATLNSLSNAPSGITTNGNLCMLGAQNSSVYAPADSTIQISSGKWYAESRFTSDSSDASFGIRVDTGVALSDSLFLPTTAQTYVWYTAATAGNRGAYCNGAQLFADSGYTFTQMISVAVDVDAGKMWFGKAGQWYDSSGSFTGDPATGANPACTFAAGAPIYVSGHAYSANDLFALFGQSAFPTSTATLNPYRSAAGGHFLYAPPQGFKALSTANLPTPAIAKPPAYFDAKIYTGTGSTQNITGLGFQPALTWLKDRASATSHGVFDAVRGATQRLAANSTAAEATDADTLTAFNADGFSLGADAKFNTDTNSYISWNWLESSTAGFDIVTYTGTGGARTIAHSLGAVPKMIITKERGGTSNWSVYHASNTAAPETAFLLLNSTNATADDTRWNDTAPATSTFSLGSTAAVNNSGDDFVAYLWAEVPGFSKFGSYTGNGDTDGTFIYTGFRPRFVIGKETTSSDDNWFILDGARDPGPGNPQPNHVVWANLTTAEQNLDTQEGQMDLLSNGFKLRSIHSGSNESGATYIYAAFAELPFKYSSAGFTSPNSQSFMAWEF